MLAVVAGFGVLAVPQAFAANWVVNSDADTSTACTVITCTLRDAIGAAQSGDTITFAIGPGGATTINLTADLPAIARAITIDGTTQTGFTGTPIVQLARTGGSVGLWLNGDGATVKGFVINSGFSNSGVLIQGNGNRLESSYVGTNAAGDTVAGSFGFGAVRIQGSNNVIGGASSAERNVIAASAGGLRVENAGSANNTIQGNYIGVNAAGTASLGATGLGIDSATGTSVLGNVIDNGISVQSSPSTTIRGNRIGTNAAGTASAGGGGAFAGVQVVGSPQTVIGGVGAGEGNAISGNGGSGIRIQSDTAVDGAGVSVRGNRIGTSADGTVSIGNAGKGVEIVAGIGGQPDVTIGGIGAGQANTIANNGAAGVFVLASASTGIVIRGNAIYGNGGIPIDLGGDGVTANDGDDVDTGPNGRQNFPVLSNAVQDGAGTVAVDWSLSTTLNTPTVNYSFDLYAGPSCGARVWVGTSDLAIGVTGTASGRLPYTSNVGSPDFLSATVTGPEGTSELSPCTAISGSFSVDDPQVSPFSVTTTADHAPDGCTFAECTLREAILAANDASVSQFINIPGGVTGTLDVALSGLGPLPTMDSDVLVDGNDAFRIVGGGTVSVGLAGANLVRDMIVTGFVTGIRDVDNIESNIIGTDALSTPGFGNGTGVELLTRNAGIVDNTISGNGVGLKLAAGFYVQGNRIGVAHTGDGALGNTGNGVEISAPFGVIVQQGNIIAHNGGAGVAILNGSTDNQITGNSIYGNVGLGIDLGDDGPGNGGATPTDPGPPERANGGQNSAFLGSATVSGGHTTVAGTQKQPADWPGGFAIDVYAGPPAALPQASRFLGTVSTASGVGVGPWAFNTNQAPDALAPALPGEVVTITIRRGSATSEFSNTVVPTVLSYTFTVDSTDDAPDDVTADGDCRTELGECTLRAAIQEINASTSGGTIEFAIPSSGTQTIAPGSALPPITKPVTIDGTTQRTFQQGSGGALTPPPAGHRATALDGGTNGYSGLELASGSDGSTIRGLALTNFEAAVGDASGIKVGSDSNEIYDNYIGLDPSGTNAGRNGHGIEISGRNNTVGSSDPADRNVISGNREGIALYSGTFGASGNSIRGNYFGTDSDGANGIPNDNSIVAENAGADGIVIGGNAPGAGNVFHSLYASIQLIGDFGPLANLTVASNRFGLNAGGAALPDADAAAVLVRNASQIDITGNVITHATDGIALEGVTDATISGNTVTDNANAGIRIIGSNLAGNTISQNAIDRNGELGIDLGNRGVTSNDSFPDELPQNAPVISSVEIAGGSATVQYSVPGAGENDSFEVEFFGSPAADASGHGEGLTYLGSETTDGSTASAVLAVGANDMVTATATRADGSTSEFSLAGNLAEVEIVPEADAMLSRDFTAQNYGSEPTADVYGGSTLNCSSTYPHENAMYTVLRFNLGAIPAGATITSARLSTFTKTGFAQNGDPAHWALALEDDNWDESTVTWNAPPSDFVADADDKSPRTSTRNLGGASVWRDNCSDESPGDQETVFPGYGYPEAKTVAAATSDFVATVAAAAANPADGKLSLQLWTPNCPECGDASYWARYYTREADPSVQPRLIVTYRLGAPVASVTLDANTDAPEAGAAEVRLDKVPPSAILDASRVVAAPLADTPLADTPLADTPLADIPLADIGFDEVGPLLTSVTLSTLPLKREGGWPAVLQRHASAYPANDDVQALADKQLQQITLGDLYALDPRPSELDPAAGPDDDITLVELDLSNSPLGGLNTLDVILGSTPLSEIGVPDLTPATPTGSNLEAWCEILAGAPISCLPGTGTSALAGASIISTALRGAPLSDTPLADTPLSDIPLSDIPLADTPLADTPLSDIPLSDTGISGIPLADVPLSDIPLADIPLADIPLADTPLADIPLADTPLADTPLADTPLSDIDIVRFPLSDIPLSDVPLSDTPLSDIPLSDVAQPAAIFVAPCNAPTIGDPACTLRPGLQYDDILGALSPSARIRVNEFVAAVDAKGKLRPGDTLGLLLHSLSIPVYQSFLALPEFKALVYPNTPNPLPGLTVEELIGIVENAANANHTLADLLAILIKSDTLGWEKLDLKQARVQEVSTNGGEVTYTARLGLNASPGGPGGSSETAVEVTLPDGFSYVPGSSTYGPDGSTTPVPDPTISGRVLTWTFDVGIDVDFQDLVFRVRPGLRLGPAVTSVDVTPVGGDTATASKSVIVGDTFEDNGSIANARPLSEDSFFLSYLTSASDVDMFSFPAPNEPGARVTFRLSHAPADYDIVVYGPAGQVLRPAPTGTPPLDGVGIADEGASLQSVTDGLAPQPLDDVPLVQGQKVLGVSTLRGIQDDGVTVVSNGLPGTYTVQVTGFNGASSNDAYMLRASVQKPENTTQTTARNVAGGESAAQLVLGTDTADVNTVFVVDREQFTGLYPGGAGAIDGIVGNLDDLAGLGYPAVVLQVDAVPEVDTAMDAWNASPGSSVLANNAVREISAVVDDFRSTHPAVTNVVLIGPDAAMPFARLDDLTTAANEKGYASTFPAESEIAASLVAGKVLSDDPYGDDNPQSFLGRQLYLPDVAVGRLVETPADIEGAVQRFVDFGGELDSSTALATGYEFLSDSAEEIAGSLEDRIPGTDRLISNAWTKGDLLNAFFAGSSIPTSITSLNGHASHNAFGPAAGRDLFRVTDLIGKNFDRKLVFSVGCHSGFSVTDVVVPGLTNTTDWAQSYQQRGGTYFGNTGYGYGDTDVSAYSEEIARIFAANLVKGTMTAGEAMFYAKQEHFGNLGLVSVYDEKASAEMTLYGLPMWKVPAAGAPVAPAARTAGPQLLSIVNAGPLATGLSTGGASLFSATSVTDPVTGIESEEFDVDPVFTPITTDRGTYLEGDDGVQATHFRPIQPKKVLELDSIDVHGALIEELTSSDEDGVDPVFQRPLVDDPAIEPELPYDDLAFPSKIQTVTTLLKPGPGGPELKKNLVLVTGQFFGDGELDEEGIGIQRRFEKIGGRAYISTSDDYTPATFEKIDAVKTDGAVTFSVELSEGSTTMKRVLVGYLEEDLQATGARIWTFVDLVPEAPNSKRWIKTITTAAERVQFFAQSVDENGNVGVTTNKALFYAGEPAPVAEPGSVAPLLNGVPPTNETFTGDVTVSATTPTPGVTVQVSVSGPDSSGGFVDPPFVAQADGVYTVIAEGSDGSTASASFVIDTKGPIISVTGPPSPGSDATPSITFSASEPGVFNCTIDGGSYSACSSPFTSGELTDGTHTFSVFGIDGNGNGGPSEATSVSFVIDATPPETEVAGPSGPTASTSATFALGPVPGATFECKLDDGDFEPCTTPKSYTSLSQGEHTFSARATDAVGNADPSPETRVWTVDTIAPETSITPPTPSSITNATGASFTFTSEPGATFLCTLDGGPASVCAPATSYSGLAQGPHTFTVSARDAAGNTDPTPAVFSWSVDLTPPVASISSGPAPPPAIVNTSVATFVFAGSDAFPPASTPALQCSLDAAPFAACTSPQVLVVADGLHSFRVRAVDAAGNTGPVVERKWDVDLIGSTIAITSPVAGASYVRGEAVLAAFTCQDLPRPTPTCTGAITAGPTGIGPILNGGALPTSAAGAYTLSVTSTDVGGNTSVATRTYVVTDLQGAVAFTRAGKIWITKVSGAGSFAPRQLTQLAGLDAAGSWVDDQASISPDGRRVVFSRRPGSPASAKRQIWVIDSTGRNAKNLTNDPGQDYNAPDWSPTGTAVAFDSTRSGSKGRDVWTASFSTASGGSLSSYANRTNANGDDVTPDWAPGALRIAFATNRHSGQFEIYSMLANGRNATRLTNDPKADVEPSFSPSGLLIGFSSDRATGTGGFELYVMGAANGNSQVRITNSPGVDGQPHFTDALTIVFASSRTTGSGAGLYTIAPSAVPPAKAPGTTLGDASPG